MNFTEYKKINNRGFTLIEMLIAIFIFTLALTSLMLVSSRGLRASKEAQNQVVANYLALEGIEAVRNLRDSSLIRFDDSNNWIEVFDQGSGGSNRCLSEGNPCTFTLGNQIELISCPNDECQVYLDEDSGIYRNFLNGPTSSRFSLTPYVREISLVIPPNNVQEIVVEVTVTWNTGSVTYSENLFLWL